MQKLALRATALGAFAVVFNWAALADAAGIAAAKFGGEHGHPTTDNATALYFNPAGLALSEGMHLYVDGTLAWRYVTFYRKESDTAEPADAQGANIGQASEFNPLAGPMFGFTDKLTKDLAVGAGFFVPFGGIGHFSQNDTFAGNTKYPGAVDGRARWWNIDGELIHAYGSVGAAYHIPDTPLSLGVAANLIYSQIKDYRARTAAGDDNVSEEGRSLLVVKGIDWSFGAGLIIEAIEKKLWLGASYQSRPNVSGGMVLGGTYDFKAPGGVKTHADADLHLDLPDVYRLGARYRPSPEVELRLFGDLTRWSAVVSHCVTQRDAAGNVQDCTLGPKGSAKAQQVIQNIPHEWQDTVGVRAGASYFSTKELELFGGIGFETGAVPDKTLEPSLSDANNVLVAGGARIAASPTIHVAFSYTQILFFSRDNTGQSELKTAYLPTSNSPTAGGSYSQQIGYVNANLDVAF